MKIRLKKNSIVIEVSKNSKYLNLISSNLPAIDAKKEKREEFLKTIYYMCVKNAQYQNPHFYKKLIRDASKQIIIDIKESLHVNKQECLKEHYGMLNSNENDSLHVIRKRYLELAKTYHPDRVIYTNRNLVQEYTNKFQKIQEAYEILKYKIAS